MDKNTVNANFINFINELKSRNIVNSDKSFCDSIGVLPQSLGDIKGNRRSVTIEMIQNTCLKYNVSSDFFLNTQNNYDAYFDAYFDAYLEPKSIQNDTKKGDKSSKGSIPLIPIEAMAGQGAGEFSALEQDLQYYNIPELSRADFVIKVSGSSMYPKYSSGDILACIYVKDASFIQYGKVYVMDTGQGAVVKRLFQSTKPNHYLCHSDNEAYKPFDISQDSVRALALVIGVIRLE